MNIPPELGTVEKFLEELGAISGLFPSITILSRRKNNDFIQKSGITEEEINDIIFKKLNKTHYKSGPEQDRDRQFPSGVLYTFVYPWQKYKIYIKIKILIRGRRSAICLSFHD